MTLRDGGILVARGLAMVFLAQGLAYGLYAVEYLPGFWGNQGWRLPGGAMASAALSILFAGFLWRSASGFTSDLPDTPNGRPIDQEGLLRAIVAGIAVYWLFDFVEKLVMLAASYLGGDWRSTYMAGLYRDVIMVAIASVVLLWAANGLARRGMTASRLISYPRSEPAEDDQQRSDM